MATPAAAGRQPAEIIDLKSSDTDDQDTDDTDDTDDIDDGLMDDEFMNNDVYIGPEPGESTGWCMAKFLLAATVGGMIMAIVWSA